MKVVAAIDHKFPIYLLRIRGLCSAFLKLGHEVVLWEVDKKSAYDTMDEIRPDYLIACSDTLKRRDVASRISVGDVKVIQLDGKTISNKEKAVNEPYYINDVDFHKVPVDPVYKTDISYIGGNHHLLPQIIELCQRLGLKIKLYHEIPLPYAHYCGIPDYSNEIVNSSDTIICNLDPELNDFYLNILYLGKSCLSVVPSISDSVLAKVAPVLDTVNDLPTFLGSVPIFDVTKHRTYTAVLKELGVV